MLWEPMQDCDVGKIYAANTTSAAIWFRIADSIIEERNLYDVAKTLTVY